MAASDLAQVEVSEKEIAAAENKAAAQKANKAEVELTEAKRRLGKAETELDAVKDVLREAQVADPVDAQRVAKAELGVAKAELGVAKAELGVAEAKLGVAEAKLGVAEAKWLAAPEGEKAVFQASVKTAQESVKTAQESVETAQEIVKTANVAYKKALDAPTATPQQGGADASQTSDDLSATLQEIRARLGVIEEGQMTLEHKLDFLTPVDPWELLSSNSSQSQTGNLRQNLKALYHPGGAQIMCVVSKVVDNDTQDGGERVVAAHLWPKSKASIFATWKSRRSQATACQDINDAANGLFLLHDIEQAFDRKQVCFICDPFKVELLFLVLDPDLLVQDRCPKGCATTWLALHKTRITEIEMNKRPAFQILSHHASLSVDAAFQKGWLTDEQKVALQASIKVTSPSTSAA